MAYSPDPDRRPPLPQGFALGMALLLGGAVLACLFSPFVATLALAALFGA